MTGLSRRKLGQVAAQGALLTLNWVLFLSALDRTSVATAELLGYTGPVFVALFAPFVTGERFDKRIFVPLALSLGRHRRHSRRRKGCAWQDQGNCSAQRWPSARR